MLIAEIGVVAALDSLRLRVRDEIALALKLRGILGRQTAVLIGVEGIAREFVPVILDRGVAF